MERVLSFYEPLASLYHLIFEDWDRSIARQARTLDTLLAKHMPGRTLRILDCACGIGTQSLGLAALGHQVTASDLSPAAVQRARDEAKARGLTIPFHVADMTCLAEIDDTGFDVVAALDNALPHLTPQQLAQAIPAIAAKLAPGGWLLASLRDYDALAVEKPAMPEPQFYGSPGSRRIVHQVWDWSGDASYTLHLYLTFETADPPPHDWKSHHFVSEYRCLLREELSSLLEDAGLTAIHWLMPSESGFHQPIVLATKPG